MYMRQDKPVVLITSSRDSISTNVSVDGDESHVFANYLTDLVKELKQHVSTVVIVVSVDNHAPDASQLPKYALLKQLGVSEVLDDNVNPRVVLDIRYDQADKYQLLSEIYERYSPDAKVVFDSSYLKHQESLEETNAFREMSETNYRDIKRFLCPIGEDVVFDTLRQKLELPDYKSTRYTAEEINTIKSVLNFYRHENGVSEIIKKLEYPGSFEQHYAFRKFSFQDFEGLKLLLSNSWLEGLHEKFFQKINDKSVTFPEMQNFKFTGPEFLTFCNFLNCHGEFGRNIFNDINIKLRGIMSANNNAGLIGVNEGKSNLGSTEIMPLIAIDWMTLQQIKSWVGAAFEIFKRITNKFFESQKKSMHTLLFNHEILLLKNFLNISGDLGKCLSQKIHDSEDVFYSYLFDHEEVDRLLAEANANAQDQKSNKEIHLFIDIDDTALLRSPSNLISQTIVNHEIIRLVKQIKNAKLHILTARPKFDDSQATSNHFSHTMRVVEKINAKLVEAGVNARIDNTNVYCLGEASFQEATKWQYLYEHVVKNRNVIACLIDDSYMQMGRISTLHAMAKMPINIQRGFEDFELDIDAANRILRVCVHTDVHHSYFNYDTMPKRDKGFHKDKVQGYLKSRLADVSARSKLILAAVFRQRVAAPQVSLFQPSCPGSKSSTSDGEYIDELYGGDDAYEAPVNCIPLDDMAL